MKKYSLLLIMLMFLLGGCTISYSTNIENPSVSDGDEDSDSDNQENNTNDGVSNEENSTIPLETPDIIDPITIDADAYFYPSTLSLTSDEIIEYTYIYEENQAKYQIYSAYYSEYYDTIYIAYDSILNPTQTLKAKDLYQMERHSLNYFTADNNKTDYKEYLKAVLIYPDTLASSCRRGLTDADSTSINGCANYVGKEAVISLNKLASMENFYKSRKEYISSTKYYLIEAMRFTFAHEFGHVSTFYHMAYRNDENYEDYLKLRLGSQYSTIYPNGLPSTYNAQGNSYYTQPSEILADDYVELFYDTSEKVSEDTYEYEHNEEYSRNSLTGYDSVKNLSDNQTLHTTLKNYYTNNFLEYSNKKTYAKPIVVSSLLDKIEYYESYSKIGKAAAKAITSNIDINLIAVGEVTVNGIKYYRVLLSNTFNTTNDAYDEKEVGKKMGYVRASIYTINSNIMIYKINRNVSSPLTKYTMVPIRNYSDIYVLPYYEFSYVLNLTTDTDYATMYDYLNTNISDQLYKIRISQFGTLVN